MSDCSSEKSTSRDSNDNDQLFSSETDSTEQLETVECYIENLVTQASIAGIQEAADNLFLEACIKAEVDILERKDLDAFSSIYNRGRQAFRQTEAFISRYMGYFTLLWVAFTFFRLLDFSHSKLLVQPPAFPKAFFPNSTSSLVTDHYFGNGASAEKLLLKSEIAVLMYYAPWSIHSIDARIPFTQVASSYSFLSTVKFAAVNCFTKYGECKRMYKLYSFPLVIAYVGRIQVVFNGPMTAPALFRFVQNLLDPVTKVTRQEELKNILDKHDFLVVGYFEFKKDGAMNELSTFTAAAMKATAAQELFGSARFVIVQNSMLAELLTLEHTDRIGFVTKSTDDSFITSSSYSMLPLTASDEIVEWAKREASRSYHNTSVAWLDLSSMEAGGKSEALQHVLAAGPVAILFTTDYGSELAESSAMKDFKKVAGSYHSCNGSTPVYSEPASIMTRIQKAKASCSQLNFTLDMIMLCCKAVSASVMRTDVSTTFNENLSECGPILAVFPFNSIARKCSSARNPQKLLPLFQPSVGERIECEWYRLLKRTSKIPAESNAIPTKDDNSEFEGLSCKSNETLRFMAVDRYSASFLLKKWGLTNESALSSTAAGNLSDLAAIISLNRESVNALNSEITVKSLTHFIHEFHKSKLGNVKVTESTRNLARTEQNGLKLQVLNTQTFERFVREKRSHDAVVWFTGGPAHGPSTTVSYIIHSAAAYFDEFDTSIKFYRIDVSSNDLPYQFTFDRLPALMFFPVGGNTISNPSRYPNQLPLTIPNVLAFILSRCNPELRWRIALSTCSEMCVERNRRELMLFFAQIDHNIRRLRITKSRIAKHLHSSINLQYLALIRNAIRRRALQRRIAIYLENMLKMLTRSQNVEFDFIFQQSMFVRWLLYKPKTTLSVIRYTSVNT